MNEMNEMKDEKREIEKGPIQPFIIVKNARKITKKRDKIRKQSLQYQPTIKKTRKMTIQISNLHSSIEENSSAKVLSQNLEWRQSQRQVAENEQDEVQKMCSIDCKEEEEEQNEGEDNIPFPCNQWELDKQSPYLKSFNSLEHEMGQFKLDE